MGRITAGSGYDYLTKAVATSRHDYYTGTGEAPGIWSGRGAPLLGLAGVVDADDMAVLYGRFVDPRTKAGVRLPSGRVAPEVILGRRVSVRTRADGSVADPIAAFDVTFSPAKSVSVLWATTTDLRVRQAVVDAHEHAVTVGLEYLEVHAGHVRAGVDGVRRVSGRGLAIARFRHRTARSTDPGTRIGDPQLHTHCAILNRVQGEDGRWRTLDSRAIYRHAHTAGDLYAATLERELSLRLGVAWVTPMVCVPMREIDGVPDRLLRLWSSRRQQVLLAFERILGDWQTRNGRTPTDGERAQMLDQATVRSRRPKSGGHLDLHHQWQTQLAPGEQVSIDNTVTPVEPDVHGAVIDGGRIPASSPQLDEAVLTALHEKRAWWNRAHVYGEVARLVTDPTPGLIEIETERIIAGCVILEADDDPVYAQPDGTRFTSNTILHAEQRTLHAATLPAPWHVSTVDTGGLGDDQVEAVTAITAGDHQLTTVIGPAGAGKTTMLKAAAAAYERAGRPVIVLTLSAAAARVVTTETGLAASTIASWRVGQVRLPRHGLLLVDEASMVPTLTLDQLVRLATAYRCRVALVGDYAQMGAPEAGGLLRDLAATPGAVHMTSVRRFRDHWERAASIQLRQRNPDAAITYDDQQRLHAVTTDTATANAAQAWLHDVVAGRDSLIVVDTTSAAADVSARCQQLLVAHGRIGARLATAADGNAICVGDLVQTRDNAHLPTSDGSRVLNRDVWKITGTTPTNEITAIDPRRRVSVTLPADYVTEHAVLAYATTIAGAQGRTVDTGHTIVTPRTVSPSLYVGMTRGRHANHAHVITDRHDHEEFQLGDRTVTHAFRAAIMRDPDGQLSATTVARRWTAAEAERTTVRDADRRQHAASDWWQLHQQQLPPRVQVAMSHRHGQIIDSLAERAPATWTKLTRTALSSTDWASRDAAQQFINFLKTVPTSTRPGSTTAEHTIQRQYR